jgi:ABC-2 type transport system ATP-binding protein
VQIRVFHKETRRCSGSQIASVDRQRRPGDVAGIIGEQEGDGCAVFGFNPAGSADRQPGFGARQRRSRCLRVLAILPNVRTEIAFIDRGWLDRIGTNTLSAIVHGNMPGQADHRVFRGRVGRRCATRANHRAGDRRGNHDRATACLDHVWDRMFGTQKHAGKIDTDNEIPVFERGFMNPAAAGSTRVGNETGHLSELGHRRGHGRCYLSLICNITDHRKRSATSVGDFRGHLHRQRLADVGNHNTPAFFSDLQTGTTADSAAAARHYDNLIVESAHLRSSVRFAGVYARHSINNRCVVYSPRRASRDPVNASTTPAAAEPILHLERISKSLGDRQVLDGVDLQVAAGELVVLLGPNGAGKTTLLGTACGRIAADAGQVSLNGQDPRRHPQARAALGYVPQDLALYPYLTVRENLQIFGRMMGVTKTTLPPRVDEALRWSGLEERAESRVDTLSGGMRRRLNIVASLLHQPAMLMLDEPTVGVDVNARERIHELLRQLRAQGLGLLLTTHDLTQATSLADRVVFLIAGRVQLSGAPQTLIANLFEDGKELLVTFLQTPDDAQAEQLKGRELFAGHSGLTWSGRVTGGYGDVGAWSDIFTTLGLEVAEIRIREPNLESVYLRVTGEELKL